MTKASKLFAVGLAVAFLASGFALVGVSEDEPTMVELVVTKPVEGETIHDLTNVRGSITSQGGGNVAPVVDLSVATDVLTATFTMTATDADGSIASWSLDIDGDAVTEYGGSGAPPATQAHTYTADGDYIVLFAATDDAGASGQVSRTVTVSATNVPPIASITVNSISGLSVTFGLSASDGDGEVDSWSLDKEDDGTPDDGAPDAPPATRTVSYPAAGIYTARLTVLDDMGAEGTDTVSVTVSVTPPPPGGPTTLWLGRAVSPAGNADGLAGEIQPMTNEFPTELAPAAVHPSWFDGGDVYDPIGGSIGGSTELPEDLRDAAFWVSSDAYALSSSTIQLSWYYSDPVRAAYTVGGILGTSDWVIRFYEFDGGYTYLGGTDTTDIDGDGFPDFLDNCVESFDVTACSAVFTGISTTGSGRIAVVIDPYYALPGGNTVIYYDSVDFPSCVIIDPDGSTCEDSPAAMSQSMDLPGQVMAAKPAPSSVPPGAFMTDELGDALIPNVPQYDLEAAWIENDDEYLYVGLKVADIPSHLEAYGFFYTVTFTTSWWAPDDPAFESLRVAAGFSPYLGNPFDGTASPSGTVSFELQYNIPGQFNGLNELPLSTLDVSTGIIWWVVPLNYFSDDLTDMPPVSSSMSNFIAEVINGGHNMGTCCFIADDMFPSPATASYSLTDMTGSLEAGSGSEIVDAYGDATLGTVPGPGWTDVREVWFDSDSSNLYAYFKVNSPPPLVDLSNQFSYTIQFNAPFFDAGQCASAPNGDPDSAEGREDLWLYMTFDATSDDLTEHYQVYCVVVANGAWESASFVMDLTDSAFNYGSGLLSFTVDRATIGAPAAGDQIGELQAFTGVSVLEEPIFFDLLDAAAGEPGRTYAFEGNGPTITTSSSSSSSSTSTSTTTTTTETTTTSPTGGGPARPPRGTLTLREDTCIGTVIAQEMVDAGTSSVYYFSLIFDSFILDNGPQTLAVCFVGDGFVPEELIRSVYVNNAPRGGSGGGDGGSGAPPPLTYDLAAGGRVAPGDSLVAVATVTNPANVAQAFTAAAAVTGAWTVSPASLAETIPGGQARSYQLIVRSPSTESSATLSVRFTSEGSTVERTATVTSAGPDETLDLVVRQVLPAGGGKWQVSLQLRNLGSSPVQAQGDVTGGNTQVPFARTIPAKSSVAMVLEIAVASNVRHLTVRAQAGSEDPVVVMVPLPNQDKVSDDLVERPAAGGPGNVLIEASVVKVQGKDALIKGRVLENRLPVAGETVKVTTDAGLLQTVTTDGLGRFEVVVPSSSDTIIIESLGVTRTVVVAGALGAEEGGKAPMPSMLFVVVALLAGLLARARRRFD